MHSDCQTRHHKEKFIFFYFLEMAEEVKAADVEMAEATPEKKPEVKELPIEDIEDLNSVS